APCTARQRVLRHACAERLATTDRVGASGGGRRNCSAAAQAQPGSRGPAGGDAEKADCEEKEASCDTIPTGSIAAGGLGSADVCAGGRTSVGAGSHPRVLSALGGCSLRDQLSLSVTIISVGG